MPSKFYILGSSCFLFLISIGQINGQPSPAPTPKVGYIRFWDMLPAANGTFDLRKAGATAQEIALVGTPFQYTSYTAFPLGKYHLLVVKRGDSVTSKAFDVDIKPETFFTILVGPQGAEMTEDTNDPKVGSATLIIRNFFPRVNVSASQGSKAIVDSLLYGQSFRASGFPLERMEVSLQTTLSTGKPAGSGAEVDFKAGSRATILIIPDSYGRFRPRVTIDGKNL